jgi:hypothetical protein
MTLSDLTAAVGPVVAALEDLDIRYYVGGSVASSAHGVARSSLDVDLVAELGLEHLDRLAARLSGAYYAPLDHMRRAIAERRSFNLIHLATVFKIDVFVSRGRPFDRSVLDRARLESIGEQPDAARLRVASAEDTVLLKLEWFRQGGESSERQWGDVLGVLKVTPAIDLAHLRRWATDLGVGDLLDRALVQASDTSD